MGDLIPMAGFFHLNKPERDHAEKILRDELDVINSAGQVASRRRDAALQELFGCNQELETLKGRRESIERLLNLRLTQPGGINLTQPGGTA